MASRSDRIIGRRVGGSSGLPSTASSTAVGLTASQRDLVMATSATRPVTIQLPIVDSTIIKSAAHFDITPAALDGGARQIGMNTS